MPGRDTLRERGETRADEGAVVAVERGDVGDRSERDEVEPATHVEIDAELRADARDEGEREADRREPLVGVSAVWAVGVQEREDRERLVGDAVVVDDDDVDAALPGVVEARVVARAAVACDEERGSRVEDARHGLVGDAVAAVGSGRRGR